MGRYRDLGYDSYGDYLAGPEWAEAKRRYRTSGLPQQCARCGNPRFELHHTTYARIGRERLSDLEPLCRSCHQAHHDDYPGWSLLAGLTIVVGIPLAIVQRYGAVTALLCGVVAVLWGFALWRLYRTGEYSTTVVVSLSLGLAVLSSVGVRIYEIETATRPTTRPEGVVPDPSRVADPTASSPQAPVLADSCGRTESYTEDDPAVILRASARPVGGALLVDVWWCGRLRDNGPPPLLALSISAEGISGPGLHAYGLIEIPPRTAPGRIRVRYPVQRPRYLAPVGGFPRRRVPFTVEINQTESGTGHVVLGAGAWEILDGAVVE